MCGQRDRAAPSGERPVQMLQALDVDTPRQFRSVNDAFGAAGQLDGGLGPVAQAGLQNPPLLGGGEFGKSQRQVVECDAAARHGQMDQARSKRTCRRLLQARGRMRGQQHQAAHGQPRQASRR
jgi:hypothetical protein